MAMSEVNITVLYKKLTENQEIVCVEPKEEKSMNQEMIEKIPYTTWLRRYDAILGVEDLVTVKK
ncbi:TPA: hypothetical protein I0H43_RS03130 [Enterococcus faecalis]|nr:hypothetical protein [Enterococcus faecalis]